MGIALDLKACAVALRSEAAKINAGLAAHAAARERHGRCFQRDTEDFADGLEVGIDRIPPVVIDMALAIPFAGVFLGLVG
jgi:hypothetical protein